ncbi:MAG: dTDP-4-dehydrorhamnose 3,5-epimerase [Vicingaceae bacterium]|nr:dTDP-4-dehydrorhamnose 3,5-epimerase [Vicingaceae bacterium]
MNFLKTEIEGLLILEPSVFSDSRGCFFESYSKNKFSEHGIETVFIQDNQSLSQKGVLRGLHFQNPPYAQAKLVSVIRGAVLDVAVDIRKKSPTYGCHVAIELSDANRRILYVPEGFAHGFLSLEDDTIFTYKCSNFYQKESENSLLWDDSVLNIDWGIDNPILSEKDLDAQSFNGFNSPFC